MSGARTGPAAGGGMVPGTVRPHVLLLSGTARSARNGSSRVEDAVARALTASGAWDVTLLTRDEQAEADTPFTHAIYQRPSTKDWRTALLAGRVSALMQGLHARRPISLVHAFAIFPCAVYAARFGAPFVVTHHNMTLTPRSAIAALAARQALARASAAIALNATQGEALRAGGVRAVHVIPNGVELDGIEGAQSAPDRLPDGFALYAARLEAAKGIHLLLDAYEAVPAGERRPLVIAGDGRDRAEVEARARALGAHVLPWLSHEALMATMRRAALLAAPSFAEASPLLLLEAYARGVPVASHDLPAIAADLRDGAGAARAHVVAIGDRAGWSRLLHRGAPVDDAAMLARAKAAAHDRAWPRVAEAYAAVYADVLGLPRSARRPTL